MCATIHRTAAEYALAFVLADEIGDGFSPCGTEFRVRVGGERRTPRVGPPGDGCQRAGHERAVGLVVGEPARFPNDALAQEIEEPRQLCALVAGPRGLCARGRFGHSGIVTPIAGGGGQFTVDGAPGPRCVSRESRTPWADPGSPRRIPCRRGSAARRARASCGPRRPRCPSAPFSRRPA